MSLFFAINPTASARAEIEAAVSTLKATATDATWIPSDDYHVTLSFLRRFDEAVVPLAERAASTVFASPFALTLNHVGAFDRAGAKPIWLGLEHSDSLVSLRERLVLAVHAAGVDVDNRPFVPHLTIAHAKEPLTATAIPAITWAADSIDLMARKPGATSYEILRRFPIGGQ